MHLTPNIDASFNARFSAVLTATGDGPVAVAVSGGGDSTALLVLAAKWRDLGNRQILAVSVNHGLRADAGAELAQIGSLAADLNVPHTILSWTDWNGRGNLQHKARDARKTLIGNWARAQGVGVIATGHNLDDQAETFLMRLARGSGVDGLTAMYPQDGFEGLNWIKPLLDVSRQQLRTYLRDANIAWSDDPSNDDPAFDRVRFRQAAETLAGLGLDATTLSNTANRLKHARFALETACLDLARNVAKVTDTGTVLFDRVRLAAAPYELQQRLMSHALRWITQTPYAPRISAVQQALAAMNARQTYTLNGCILVSGKGAHAELCREPNAVMSQPASTGLFDGRWQVEIADAPANATLGALGAMGLTQMPNWRASGHSRWALLGSPALWQNDQLIAAPFVVTSNTCRVILLPDSENFYTSILTH